MYLKNITDTTCFKLLCVSLITLVCACFKKETGAISRHSFVKFIAQLDKTPVEIELDKVNIIKYSWYSAVLFLQ